MEKTYSKRAVKNLTYIFVTWFSRNILGILFWIVLGNLLSPQELGSFSTIFNFGIFLTTFALLGLSPASIKLISEYIGKGKIKNAKALTTYIFKVNIFSLSIISFLVFIFSPQLSKFLDIPEQQILLSIPLLLSISLLYLSSSVSYALGKPKEFAIGNIIFSILKLILPPLVIFLWFSYEGLILAISFSAIVGVIYRLKVIKFGNGKVEKRRIWRFASSSIIGALSSSLYNQGGILLTKAFTTAANTGIFTLGFMLSMPLRTIPNSLANAIFPLESEAWSKGKKSVVRKLIKYVLKYSYLFCIPLILIFLVFSQEIMFLIGGKEYIGELLFIKILVLALGIMGISSIFSGSLYFIGKPELTRNLNVLSGILTFLFGILLIKIWNLLGISLAYLISAILIFFVSYYFSKKYIGISFEGKYFFLVFFSSLISLPILYFFKLFFHNIIGVFFGALFFGIVYLLTLLMFGYFNKKDLDLLKIVGRKLPSKTRKKLKMVERLLEGYVK